MRATTNKLTPFYPIHPGEILKDKIEYRGISQRKLAAQTGISYTLLNEMLNSKRPVTTEYALLFEAALDMDADTFVRMQARYNMQKARKAKRLAQVRKIAAAVL
ncbi:MAG: HigA family addiction module antidote protein [Bacteroidales bacterium]|jgi:addiction module HigA family antidote|nr:HigA family addiction module antidote protein [Bacteroidales bacterium]